jgi:hypothetical protein
MSATCQALLGAEDTIITRHSHCPQGTHSLKR